MFGYSIRIIILVNISAAARLPSASEVKNKEGTFHNAPPSKWIIYVQCQDGVILSNVFLQPSISCSLRYRYCFCF